MLLIDEDDYLEKVDACLEQLINEYVEIYNTLPSVERIGQLKQQAIITVMLDRFKLQ